MKTIGTSWVRGFILGFVLHMSLTSASSADVHTCGGNARPEWILPVPQREVAIREGERLEVVLPFASDPEGDQVAYSIINMPLGATFDSSSHRFEWVPPPSSVNGRTTSDGLPSDWVIYLDAADSCGLSVRFQMNFSIVDSPSQSGAEAAPFILEDGPFFPVHAHGIGLREGGRAQLPYMRQLGFNTVSTQAIGRSVDHAFPSPGAERAAALEQLAQLALRYLDEAKSAGLKVILQVHQPEVLSRNEIRYHPNLFAIELPCDERDYTFFPLAYPNSPQSQDPLCSDLAFREQISRIRSSTPEIRIYANYTAFFSAAARPIDYRTEAITARYREDWSALDLIGFDYYLQNSVPTLQIPQPTTLLSGMVEEASGLSAGRPILPLLEAVRYGLSQRATDQTFPITPTDIRRQLSAVLSAGASGVGYYAANDLADHSYLSWDLSPELEGVSGFPGILARLLDSIEIEEPLVVSTGEGLTLLSIGARPNGLVNFGIEKIVWSFGDRGASLMATQECRGAVPSAGCDDLFLRYSQLGSHVGLVKALVFLEDGSVGIAFKSVEESSFDYCPLDLSKRLPGVCGCGVSDRDLNSNLRADCLDPSVDIPPDHRGIRISKSRKELTIEIPAFEGVRYEIRLLSARGMRVRVLRSERPQLTLARRALKAGVYRVQFRYLVSPNGLVSTPYSRGVKFRLRKR